MSAFPFDQRDGFIWMNGNLVVWKEAKLHVLSHALHYASTARLRGRARLCRPHFQIRRTLGAVQNLGGTARFRDSPVFRGGTGQGKAARRRTKNNLPNCYVRPIAWRGSETMAWSRPQNSTINVAIAVWDWPSMFDIEQKMQGIRLDIADYRRPDPMTAPARAKAAGLYMICTISKHRAEQRLCRCDDVRLAGAGRARNAPAPISFSPRRARSTRRSPIAFSMGSRGAP